MRKLAILLLSLTWFASAEPVVLPEGEGRKLVKTNCLICHSQELILGQRLSAEIWAKEVEKMAGWGSPIKEADKKMLVEYLSRHYGVDTPVPPPERERFSFE